MDVLTAMKWWETGQVGIVLGPRPLNHLVRGIEIFRGAYAAVTDHDRAEEKKRREEEEGR